MLSANAPPTSRSSLAAWSAPCCMRAFCWSYQRPVCAKMMTQINGRACPICSAGHPARAERQQADSHDSSTAQGMTAPASPRGAHALPQKSAKPCGGCPGIFTSAQYFVSLPHCFHGAPPGMPWPQIWEAQPSFEGLLHPECNSFWGIVTKTTLEAVRSGFGNGAWHTGDTDWITFVVATATSRRSKSPETDAIWGVHTCHSRGCILVPASTMQPHTAYHITPWRYCNTH